MVRFGRHGESRFGKVCRGGVWLVGVWQARLGRVWLGFARHGPVWQAWIGWDRFGLARQATKTKEESNGSISMEERV